MRGTGFSVLLLFRQDPSPARAGSPTTRHDGPSPLRHPVSPDPHDRPVGRTTITGVPFRDGGFSEKDREPRPLDVTVWSLSQRQNFRGGRNEPEMKRTHRPSNSLPGRLSGTPQTCSLPWTHTGRSDVRPYSSRLPVGE